MSTKKSSLELTENEKLWLNEIYQLFLQNQFSPDIKFLKRKLMSQLNPHFDPKKINPIYLKNGNKITPFAIRYIEPESKCLEDIDFIIKTIKDMLISNDITEIRIKDLSRITNFSISRINQILQLISTFDGSRFWSGYGYEKNGDYIYINVDSEDTIDEYIAYIDIDTFLNKENFIKRALKATQEKYQFEKSPKQITSHPNIFIEEERIVELKNITSDEFDLSKLIRLCEELNSAYENGNFLSMIFLIRSILDHIPPIFGRRNFTEVVNNSRRSTKEVLDKLESISRKIADKHLHTQVSNKHTLPNRKQISFHAELDFLLCEIIEELSTK